MYYGLINSMNRVSTPAIPIVSSGLKLYYDVSNPLSYSGSGTTLNDLSGNSNTATLYNGVGYSSSNGGVLTLDGVNDYISAPHSTSIALTNTGGVFIWLKLNVSGSFRSIYIEKGDSINNASSYGIFKYDSYEYVEISSASTINQIFLTPSVTVWQQIGLVWNGSTVKKYVNGAEVSSVAQTINVNDLGSALTIGKRTLSSGFYCDMIFGECYIYDSITPSNITANFNATKTRYGL